MKVGANRGQLFDSQKTARAHWANVCDLWDDQMQREFEEQTWVPLDKNVSDVLRAVDQLSVIFSQIRSECEFPG
jgi:hypothetical protein